MAAAVANPNDGLNAGLNAGNAAHILPGLQGTVANTEDTAADEKVDEKGQRIIWFYNNAEIEKLKWISETPFSQRPPNEDIICVSTDDDFNEHDDVDNSRKIHSLLKYITTDEDRRGYARRHLITSAEDFHMCDPHLQELKTGKFSGKYWTKGPDGVPKEGPRMGKSEKPGKIGDGGEGRAEEREKGPEWVQEICKEEFVVDKKTNKKKTGTALLTEILEDIENIGEKDFKNKVTAFADVNAALQKRRDEVLAAGEQAPPVVLSLPLLLLHFVTVVFCGFLRDTAKKEDGSALCTAEEKDKLNKYLQEFLIWWDIEVWTKGYPADWKALVESQLNRCKGIVPKATLGDIQEYADFRIPQEVAVLVERCFGPEYVKANDKKANDKKADDQQADDPMDVDTPQGQAASSEPQDTVIIRPSKDHPNTATIDVSAKHISWEGKARTVVYWRTMPRGRGHQLFLEVGDGAIKLFLATSFTKLGLKAPDLRTYQDGGIPEFATSDKDTIDALQGKVVNKDFTFCAFAITAPGKKGYEKTPQKMVLIQVASTEQKIWVFRSQYGKYQALGPLDTAITQMTRAAGRDDAFIKKGRRGRYREPDSESDGDDTGSIEGFVEEDSAVGLDPETKKYYDKMQETRQEAQAAREQFNKKLAENTPPQTSTPMSNDQRLLRMEQQMDLLMKAMQEIRGGMRSST